MSTLGDNITRLRTARGISMSGLARLCGLMWTTIRDIEQRDADPKVSTVIMIKRVLLVSYEDLLGDSELGTSEEIAEAIRQVGEQMATGNPAAYGELRRLTAALNAGVAPAAAKLPPHPAERSNGKARQR